MVTQPSPPSENSFQLPNAAAEHGKPFGDARTTTQHGNLRGMPTPQQSMAHRVGGRPHGNRAWQTMWGTLAPQSMANRVGDAHHNGAWQTVWGGSTPQSMAKHVMFTPPQSMANHVGGCPRHNRAWQIVWGGCPHYNFAWKTVWGCTRRYRAVGIGVVIFYALCDGRPVRNVKRTRDGKGTTPK